MLGVADEIAQKYLNKVKIKDEFISAACPIHSEGKERHPSFWIERATGKWGCFACSAHGGSLRFLLKELNLGNRQILAEIEQAEKESAHTVALIQAKKKKKDRADFKGVHVLPEALLGVYDYAPVSLLKAGFDENLLEAHNIGFDRVNRRITFPVRDLYGNLVGISGRATRPEDYPKYKFYDGRKVVDGKENLNELGEWFPEYSNDGVRDHLWRGHLVYTDLFDGKWDQLIIVEGFKAALWMVQQGWFHTVATMGTKMTSTQARLISRLGATIFVFPDNNGPGQEAARYWCQTLAVGSFPVYRVRYPARCDEDAQPDDLSEEELRQSLENAERAGGSRDLRLQQKRRGLGPNRFSRQGPGSKKRKWRKI